MIWQSLASLFRRNKARGPSAEAELVEAYRWLGTTQKGQLIVADLAAFSGFFEVTEAYAPPEIRAFNDGKRAAFGRLFHFLNLGDEERQALLAAARLERQVDAAEGPIDP